MGDQDPSEPSEASLPVTSGQLAPHHHAPSGPYDSGAPRLGMATVLLEHGGEVLSDELRTGDAAFAGSTREQPIVLWVERNGGRLSP
jgi:hypothetical protein